MRLAIFASALIVLAGCNHPPTRNELVGAYDIPIQCFDLEHEEPVLAPNLTEGQKYDCMEMIAKAEVMDEALFREKLLMLSEKFGEAQKRHLEMIKTTTY